MNAHLPSPARLSPWPLICILTVAFLLRAGWGLRQPDADHLGALPDQVEYLQLSQSLLRDHRLAFFDDRPNVREMVRAYRTPGYPLFLAACGANVRIARLLQALIGASTVLGIYLLARRWLNHRISIMGAALAAINPYLIYFSGLILSETLYTSMLLWGMVIMSRERPPEPLPPAPGASARTAISGWTMCGLLLMALAVLVRPSGLFLPIVLGAAVPLLNRSTRHAYHFSRAVDAPAADARIASQLRYAALGACTGAVLLAAVLLPWAARNRAILGQWIATTTNGGITLYDGYNPVATGASNQSFVAHMPQVRYPLMAEVARGRYFASLARQWACAHPWKVAKLTIAKVARTWSPIPLSREYGGRWAYVLVGALFAIPLDVLILLGLANTRLPWAIKVFLLLPALYFTVVHGLSVGSLRYRMPAEAPMAILAGCGLALIVNKLYPSTTKNPG